MTDEEAKRLKLGDAVYIKPFSQLCKKYGCNVNDYGERVPDFLADYPSWCKANFFWPDGEAGRSFRITELHCDELGLPRSIRIGVIHKVDGWDWWFRSDDFDIEPEVSNGIEDADFEKLF